MSISDEHIDPDVLHFLALGGAEEFGCNFNLYAYQGKWLVMDCGMGFADERHPSIDILLPKPDFIEERRKDIAGIVITHAHEDHIGALPYLWPRLRAPVYCSPFTAEVLRRKLREAPQSSDMEIIEITPGHTFDLNPFSLEFLGVPHSIPEAMATLIHTDAGTVLHTGDWNLDPAPQIGETIRAEAFKRAGDEGILAYVGDSTNSQVDGRTPAETEVEVGLTNVFAQQKGRIIVTTFSSNVGRIRSIAKAAEANGRSVALVGRSLQNMVGAAFDCGYLDDVADFVTEEDVENIARDNIVLIATGSQGESRAALSRIARGEHRNLRVERGDTVIFSSREIPGNEREINAVINALMGSGVHVITARSTPERIHVSGHPRREELKDMMSWIRPKIALPVHGERMMTEAHAELALACGVPYALVPGNGRLVALHEDGPEVIDHIETGFLGVEPKRLIETESTALSSRRKLQYAGVMFVTVALDERCALLETPQVFSLGLEEVGSEAEAELHEDVRGEISDTLVDIDRDDRDNDHVVSEELRIVIRRMLTHIYGFKPHVVIHLVRGA